MASRSLPGEVKRRKAGWAALNQYVRKMKSAANLAAKYSSSVNDRGGYIDIKQLSTLGNKLVEVFTFADIVNKEYSDMGVIMGLSPGRLSPK